jgi:hypothetical protein
LLVWEAVTTYLLGMYPTNNLDTPRPGIPADRPDLQHQVRENKIVAASSVGAAIFLTSIKIVIGIWTGSPGILAEADRRIGEVHGIAEQM